MSASSDTSERVCTNHCNYCKTIAADVETGYIGGPNAVLEHTDGGKWPLVRCDMGTWSIGFGAVDSEKSPDSCRPEVSGENSPWVDHHLDLVSLVGDTTA